MNASALLTAIPKPPFRMMGFSDAGATGFIKTG
jgi:hypothetical protein